MGSYQNPVGKGDPYDKYRVEPVGERQSKREGQGPPDDKPPKERVKFALYVLNLFKRAVDFFLDKNALGAESKSTSKTHLHQLKKSFEILKNEDRSEDVKFLNSLSDTWMQLLEESLYFENDKVEAKFRLLVKEIQSYPENETHSFGYYLSEYAGQKWVPFPYMELIQKIHNEHMKNPMGSSLSKWTQIIDDINLLLNP